MLLSDDNKIKGITLLIVEDNPDFLFLLRKHLKQQSPLTIENIIEQKSLKEGLATIKTSSIDLVILDLGLEDSSGIETLQGMIAGTSNAIPIVVLTNINDQQLGIELIKIGAQDYIPKDIVNPNILSRSMIYAIERHHIQEKILSTEKRLHEVEQMESIGRLMSGFAHKFNNLLATINGYTEYLLTMDSNSPIEDELQAIVTASEQASSLVSQIQSAGDLQIHEPKFFSLDEELDKLTSMLQMLISDKIEFNFVISSSNYSIFADPRMIRDAIFLIYNYLKDEMMDRGRIDLNIEYVNDHSIYETQGGAKYSLSRPTARIRINAFKTPIAKQNFETKTEFEASYGPHILDSEHYLSVATNNLQKCKGKLSIYREDTNTIEIRINLPLTGNIEKINQKERSTDPFAVLLIEKNSELIRMIQDNISKMEEVELFLVNELDHLKIDETINLAIIDFDTVKSRIFETIESLEKNIDGLSVLVSTTDDLLINKYPTLKEYTFLQKPYTLLDLVKHIPTISIKR